MSKLRDILCVIYALAGSFALLVSIAYALQYRDWWIFLPFISAVMLLTSLVLLRESS